MTAWWKDWQPMKGEFVYTLLSSFDRALRLLTSLVIDPQELPMPKLPINDQRLAALEIVARAMRHTQPRIIDTKKVDEKYVVVYTDASWEEKFSGLGALIL